eukprot:TRINITY_DN529_c0_g2_i1.p2 TRINITY_DN529_c0_g2~~TRINITY_DN529_c0_g2_i1.p2  ORF type:complete len:156 (+),score=48.63 TRINITY_DN529_c0_g2_i1:469-936(+)
MFQRKQSDEAAKREECKSRLKVSYAAHDNTKENKKIQFLNPIAALKNTRATAVKANAQHAVKPAARPAALAAAARPVARTATHAGAHVAAARAAAPAAAVVLAQKRPKPQAEGVRKRAHTTGGSSAGKKPATKGAAKLKRMKTEMANRALLGGRL